MVRLDLYREAFDHILQLIVFFQGKPPALRSFVFLLTYPWITRTASLRSICR